MKLTTNHCKRDSRQQSVEQGSKLCTCKSGQSAFLQQFGVDGLWLVIAGAVQSGPANEAHAVRIAMYQLSELMCHENRLLVGEERVG